MRSLRQRLREGQVTGLFLQTPHPLVAEALGGLGPDFVCIDQEHAPLGVEVVHALVGAATLAGLPALVRVPGPLPHRIAAALDAGAAGVLVPRVESGTTAADIVRWSRYPPAGERGVGPSRATAYGRAPVDGSDETVVGVEIETRAGVEELDAIVAADGLDLVFVGPGDLALSLGLGGGIADPALAPVVTDVLDRAAAADKATGVFALDAGTGAAWLARGVRMVIVGSDLAFLTGAVEEAWRTLGR